MPKQKLVIPLKLNDAEKDQFNLPLMPKEIRTAGQKAADRLTAFCGSWTFIISALVFIAVWILLNLFAWEFSWDPWPFILLNLALSCLAAMQAPIILMSQNREAQRDRLNQRYDYLVDRKTGRDAEKILKEIETLKRKLDLLVKK